MNREKNTPSNAPDNNRASEKARITYNIKDTLAHFATEIQHHLLSAPSNNPGKTSKEPHLNESIQPTDNLDKRFAQKTLVQSFIRVKVNESLEKENFQTQIDNIRKNFDFDLEEFKALFIQILEVKEKELTEEEKQTRGNSLNSFAEKLLAQLKNILVIQGLKNKITSFSLSKKQKINPIALFRTVFKENCDFNLGKNGRIVLNSPIEFRKIPDITDLVNYTTFFINLNVTTPYKNFQTRLKTAKEKTKLKNDKDIVSLIESREQLVPIITNFPKKNVEATNTTDPNFENNWEETKSLEQIALRVEMEKIFKEKEDVLDLIKNEFRGTNIEHIKELTVQILEKYVISLENMEPRQKKKKIKEFGNKLTKKIKVVLTLQKLKNTFALKLKEKAGPESESINPILLFRQVLNDYSFNIDNNSRILINTDALRDISIPEILSNLAAQAEKLKEVRLDNLSAISENLKQLKKIKDLVLDENISIFLKQLNINSSVDNNINARLETAVRKGKVTKEDKKKLEKIDVLLSSIPLTPIPSPKQNFSNLKDPLNLPANWGENKSIQQLGIRMEVEKLGDGFNKIKEYYPSTNISAIKEIFTQILECFYSKQTDNKDEQTKVFAKYLQEALENSLALQVFLDKTRASISNEKTTVHTTINPIELFRTVIPSLSIDPTTHRVCFEKGKIETKKMPEEIKKLFSLIKTHGKNLEKIIKNPQTSEEKKIQEKLFELLKNKEVKNHLGTLNLHTEQKETVLLSKMAQKGKYEGILDKVKKFGIGIISRIRSKIDPKISQAFEELWGGNDNFLIKIFKSIPLVFKALFSIGRTFFSGILEKAKEIKSIKEKTLIGKIAKTIEIVSGRENFATKLQEFEKALTTRIGQKDYIQQLFYRIKSDENYKGKKQQIQRLWEKKGYFETFDSFVGKRLSKKEIKILKTKKNCTVTNIIKYLSNSV